jgi:hypothetical protein
MRVYLNGPADEVKGAEEKAKDAAERIRKHGHEVVVGRTLWLADLPFADRYRNMLGQLLRCDSICNLVGCEFSWGGRQMKTEAKWLGVQEWVE